MASSLTTPMWAVTALLVCAGGWRWHEAAVVVPDRIDSIHTPAAVLLVRQDDCPIRRAAMSTWLERVSRARDGGGPLPLFLGVLSDGPGSVTPELEELPRIDARDAERAGRALLRAGLSGTPAIVLFDHTGRILLAEAFTEDGPGPRLALAARLIPALTSGGSEVPSSGLHPATEGR